MSKYDSEIAHAWAHGHAMPPQKHSRMYFEGDTIYSYGRHFPIAKHYDGVVLFTKQGYSPTTSGHIRSVKQAIPSSTKVVYCEYIPSRKDDTDTHNKNIAQWIHDVHWAYNKLQTARKKEQYVSSINVSRAEATKYIELFKLKLSKHDHKKLFAESLEEYSEAVKKEAKAKERKEQSVLKKGRELHPKWLAAWRNFGEREFAKELSRDERDAIEKVESENKTRDHARLRTDGTFVFTSKQVSPIPVDVAKRYYNKYIAVVAAGGCKNNCKYQMIGFDVNEMSETHLHVGCHLIERSEIDYIAKKLNWIK